MDEEDAAIRVLAYRAKIVANVFHFRLLQQVDAAIAVLRARSDDDRRGAANPFRRIFISARALWVPLRDVLEEVRDHPARGRAAAVRIEVQRLPTPRALDDLNDASNEGYSLFDRLGPMRRLVELAATTRGVTGGVDRLARDLALIDAYGIAARARGEVRRRYSPPR